MLVLHLVQQSSSGTDMTKLIHMAQFQDIQVGNTAELSHVLTNKDVEIFAQLTGDLNPLHVDTAFAKRTLYQKPVVHGMLSASFISTMIGMVLPGGGALWMRQTLEFLRPAHVGDHLHVKARVKQKSVATRVLILEVVITNQFGEDLIKGESSVKVLELNEEGNVMDVHTKNILITGASRGIGAATALKLGALGHAVIINYNSSAQEAQEVVQKIISAGGRALAIKADIGNTNDVEALFEQAEKIFGAVETVVHCAAPSNAPKAFAALDWNAFQGQIDIHLKGAFNCAQAALPKMLEAKRGELIFLGTVYTDGTPPTQQSRYVVAKSALSAFARCLAVEYGQIGIRINIVAPGMTQTAMIADVPEKAKMLTQMQTPLRRLAQPEDIADTIAFLLSPYARHITGETIRVCGGSVMV